MYPIEPRGSVYSLNKGWKIARDPDNRGCEEGWFHRDPPPEAESVPVPGIIQQVYPEYHGVAWYWLRFKAERTPGPQERALLHFGAVDYLAQVWLNGELLGGHEGGETPFELDATAALLAGAENRLVVRVLNPSNERIDGLVLKEVPHRNKIIPYRVGSSFAHGGIVLPVELRLLPAWRIRDVFVKAAPDTGRVRLELTLTNDTSKPAVGRLQIRIRAAEAAGTALAGLDQEVALIPGETALALDTLQIASPRLWCPEDPYLYRASARLTVGHGASEADMPSEHEYSVRFGFRDFRVERGFFRLNGKRVFVRSTHTGNHFPIGQQIPVDPDLVRRDLINAKAAGFNMVRFIAGIPLPEQLDCCDELGLMVYEENYAAWCLENSPEMGARFDASTLEMIARDRNHPSITIWGLLNETPDGPVFRQAVNLLPRLRQWDDTRLVLLGSGRWDCQWAIGSLSNPGSSTWEHAWGVEAPDAPPAPASWSLGYPGGYFQNAGDAHVYPGVPHTPETLRFIRTLGQGTKPVFLSEYGIGSLFNVVREMHRFEQVGARLDLEDVALMRSMADRLQADWQRFGMDDVYPFLEDMLRDSQRLHARQRLLGFDLIRANPQINGYNLTGMLDHGMTGEGLWTFWREWKPGIVDALSDGWAPLRWCLFVEPLHGYLGRPTQLEAVLANEDVLRPGAYPVRFRVSGPQTIAWDKAAQAILPQPAPGEDAPLAVPVLREEVLLAGPAGVYELAANMEQGGAPAGGRLRFTLSDPGALPQLDVTVTAWGLSSETLDWLRAHGVRARAWNAPSEERELILVGDVSAQSDLASWRELARRVACGSVAVFLSPAAFQRSDSPVGWLPLAEKGRCYRFGDWLYHKECVAKAHPIFAGLPARGIMDWDYYGMVIPQYLFDGQPTPDEVVAAAFAVSYPIPGGYASGVLLGGYRLGAGQFWLNTLRLLENLDRHPAADRLLLNLIAYGTGALGQPPAPLPTDWEAQLQTLGYGTV